MSVLLDRYFLDLESVKPGEAVVRDGDGWLYFSDPSRVLTTGRLDQVPPILELASNHAELGGWAAGFVSFDAGPAFDEAIRAQRGHHPLAWLALFDRPPASFRELRPPPAHAHVDLAEPELAHDQYRARFAKVHEALARGETYQVNLTFRQNFRLTGSPVAFFAGRCGHDPPPYAAFIHGGEWRVVSFSPELFFERRGADIRSQPMKGTRPRPADPLDENLARHALALDPKSRAENVMIVDMVRNDLGAVAEPGSIAIDELLQVRRHRGLLQMTSTVSAATSATVPQLFKSLFPPASVTGAPKVATCRLIAELEASPRGVYCGAIGFMTPGRQRFNVAIRTAWIDAESGEGEFGIGSGIVWDSEVESEYAECLAKRDFLIREGEPWALTQSIPLHVLGDPTLVGAHLDRLENSAKAFEIPFDREAAVAAIDAIPASDPDERMRLRLLLFADGRFSAQPLPSTLPPGPITAALATEPVDSTDPNLRHKTTSRSVYNRHLEAHPEADEVLLYNEHGEITEFCRGNVVLEIDGKLVTPDPEVGCLPGVGIARLIEEGKVQTGRPVLDDLARATAANFVNSVLGMVQVKLMDASGAREPLRSAGSVQSAV